MWQVAVCRTDSFEINHWLVENGLAVAYRCGAACPTNADCAIVMLWQHCVPSCAPTPRLHFSLDAGSTHRIMWPPKMLQKLPSEASGLAPLTFRLTGARNARCLHPLHWAPYGMSSNECLKAALRM